LSESSNKQQVYRKHPPRGESVLSHGFINDYQKLLAIAEVETNSDNSHQDNALKTLFQPDN
jgi:hypothetical protein